MILPSWILLHTFYAVTAPSSDATVNEDFRGVCFYILMCIALFKFCNPMEVAVAMSCVIGCFFVICVVIHRILMIYFHQDKYWVLFMILNNLLIAATVFCYG